MRTLWAILLLGVVTYVQAVQDHECAPLAVNVEESKIERTGFDANNKSLSLAKFLQKKTGSFYLEEVTASEKLAARFYCVPQLYSLKTCGGVEYATKLHDDQVIDENLLKGKKFDTTFIAINLLMGEVVAFEYKMTIVGTNEHDFIFQWDSSTKIESNLIGNANPQNRHGFILSNIISDALAKEFALYSYYPGAYYIYLTCDKKVAWVTFEKGTSPSEAIKQALFLETWHLTQALDIRFTPIKNAFPPNLSEYLETIYAKPPVD